MRRIQYTPLCTGTVDDELRLADWALRGNDHIERRILDKRQAACANGLDFTDVLLWMPVGAKIQYEPDDVERKRGRYGMDGVTDGRSAQNPALAHHIAALPSLIDWLCRVDRLGVIAYLGCPRYTNALMALRDTAMSSPQSTLERLESRAAYRRFWLANLRPFEGAEIALDAMASAQSLWGREFETIYWHTGSAVIVEGAAPRFGRPTFARDTSIISMMRNEKDAQGRPTLDRLAAWPGPERIALFSAAEDWEFWASVGDRRAVVEKCEAAGVSVCCDWSAV